MIRYDLVCKKGHEFEGWFRDSAAYDTQCAAGELACPQCGSKKVSKALMAPAVHKSGRGGGKGPADRAAVAREVQQFMTKLREHVETNCDYVGDRFPEEARRIHYGESDARDIYGEATIEEAKELIEEGVAVAPVPGIVPKSKAN